jgi:hypothetical protein
VCGETWEDVGGTWACPAADAGVEADVAAAAAACQAADVVEEAYEASMAAGTTPEGGHIRNNSRPMGQLAGEAYRLVGWHVADLTEDWASRQTWAWEAPQTRQGHPRVGHSPEGRCRWAVDEDRQANGGDHHPQRCSVEAANRPRVRMSGRSDYRTALIGACGMKLMVFVEAMTKAVLMAMVLHPPTIGEVGRCWHPGTAF